MEIKDYWNYFSSQELLSQFLCFKVSLLAFILHLQTFILAWSRGLLGCHTVSWPKRRYSATSLHSITT